MKNLCIFNPEGAEILVASGNGFIYKGYPAVLAHGEFRQMEAAYYGFSGKAVERIAVLLKKLLKYASCS